MACTEFSSDNNYYIKRWNVNVLFHFENRQVFLLHLVYIWITLSTLLKYLPCKMLNPNQLCLLTNTLYLWNPQPGQKTLETLSGTVPVSAFCSVYWGLSLSSPPPPPHSCPSGGIPGKRKIFNFNSSFTQHIARHLMSKEHGNNDTRVWSSSNACYMTRDWLKKKERT